MYKENLALNNLQWLICHKTQTNHYHLYNNVLIIFCSVGWGCRIRRLHLCRGVRSPPLNECPGYDTKQFDEVTVMQELWWMRSTPLLPSLPGPLWPGVVTPDMSPINGLNRTKPCFLHYTEFCI